jgi:hypothetical protein
MSLDREEEMGEVSIIWQNSAAIYYELIKVDWAENANYLLLRD